MHRFLYRRVKGTLDWKIENDEPFIWLAEHIALEWMIREYNYKKKVKGGLIFKGCGILAEVTFRSMLDELNVHHICTEPLLDKKHPVNIGKIFDFELSDGTSIDVKALPPTKNGENLNLNQWEAQNIGICDFYILFKCSGEFSDAEKKDMIKLDEQSAQLAERLLQQHKIINKESQFSIVEEKLLAYFKRIAIVKFIAYISGEDLVRKENLRPEKVEGWGDYYGLTVHYSGAQNNIMQPFHSFKEFTEKVLHVQH